jgi:probable phosphoglycerate mutase
MNEAATTVFLARHGSTDAIGRHLSGRDDGVGLNSAGQREAAALAERLAAHDIAAIYSSPLRRARQTAAPIARRLDRPVALADDLTEIDFGGWSGLAFSELDSRPDWRQWNAARSISRPPGGESMLDAQHRIIGFIERLCGSAPGLRAVLVSHAEVIRAALLFYLGVALDFFWRIEIAPASLSAVAVGPQQPRVLFINRAAEL